MREKYERSCHCTTRFSCRERQSYPEAFLMKRIQDSAPSLPKLLSLPQCRGNKTDPDPRLAPATPSSPTRGEGAQTITRKILQKRGFLGRLSRAWAQCCRWRRPESGKAKSSRATPLRKMQPEIRFKSINWDTCVLLSGPTKEHGGSHGNPLQFSCLENAHGQRSLAWGSWGHKELEATERLITAQN